MNDALPKSEKPSLADRRAKKQDSSRKKNNKSYQSKRADIIRVSQDLFFKNGYDGTTLSDISAAVAMDRATLYYYISSKDDIFNEISNTFAQKNVEEIEQIVGMECSPVKKLELAVFSLNNSYRAAFPILQIFLNKFLDQISFSNNENSLSSEWSQRYYNAIKTILQQGREQGYFETDLPDGVAALGIIGMLNWAQVTSRRKLSDPSEGRLSPAEIGAGFSRMIFHGIMKR